jgi:cell division protein FtsL
MPIEFDRKISLGNILTLGAMVVAVAGFVIAFYYKTNSTADKVAELSADISSVAGDMKNLNKSVDDNDKNMRLLVDSASSGIKQEINLMRTEVVKIATEQNGMQRQIEDMKDDLRDLEP